MLSMSDRARLRMNIYRAERREQKEQKEQEQKEQKEQKEARRLKEEQRYKRWAAEVGLSAAGERPAHGPKRWMSRLEKGALR